ncbi:hypothetical protein BC628DRAFT_1045066 [Trametes gibbosa]|nr:hypothetical protein BC628DRAFT_1045066 [Trametes gibbosa]
MAISHSKPIPRAPARHRRRARTRFVLSIPMRIWTRTSARRWDVLPKRNGQTTKPSHAWDSDRARSFNVQASSPTRHPSPATATATASRRSHITYIASPSSCIFCTGTTPRPRPLVHISPPGLMVIVYHVVVLPSRRRPPPPPRPPQRLGPGGGAQFVSICITHVACRMSPHRVPSGSSDVQRVARALTPVSRAAFPFCAPVGSRHRRCGCSRSFRKVYRSGGRRRELAGWLVAGMSERLSHTHGYGTAWFPRCPQRHLCCLYDARCRYAPSQGLESTSCAAQPPTLRASTHIYRYQLCDVALDSEIPETDSNTPLPPTASHNGRARPIATPPPTPPPPTSSPENQAGIRQAHRAFPRPHAPSARGRPVVRAISPGSSCSSRRHTSSSSTSAQGSPSSPSSSRAAMLHSTSPTGRRACSRSPADCPLASLSAQAELPLRPKGEGTQHVRACVRSGTPHLLLEAVVTAVAGSLTLVLFDYAPSGIARMHTACAGL